MVAERFAPRSPLAACSHVAAQDEPVQVEVNICTCASILNGLPRSDGWRQSSDLENQLAQGRPLAPAAARQSVLATYTSLAPISISRHNDDMNAKSPHQVTPTAHDSSPPLLQDRSFWGMTATQFLGAFNDNLFKQLMLLLAIPVMAAVLSSAGSASVETASKKSDAQGMAMMVFSLPFILFSGFAGYLSDRYSKQRVILLAKGAEIFIMLLGLLGFLAFGVTGYGGLLGVLFLMGTHSAFFGPGKYGILPELFRKDDLPKANGIILMTTFLAIILGTASAGLLGGMLNDANGQRDPTRLWMGSAICMVIAGLGTMTALLVRRTPPAAPHLRFTSESLFIPGETRRLLAKDRPLLAALLASCLFWLVCGVAMTTVNSLGMVQLKVGEQKTSLLTAVIGIGIAVGAVLAGRLSGKLSASRIVNLGAWGIIATLGLLSLSFAEKEGYQHLLGFYGSLPALMALGAAAGLFAIPVQVFIQTRPPEDQKGQMIATMNLTNFIAIFLSGAIYEGFSRLVEFNHWPRSVIFLFTALLVIPVALFYHPRDEAI